MLHGTAWKRPVLGQQPKSFCDIWLTQQRWGSLRITRPGQAHDDCNYSGLNSMPEVLLMVCSRKPRGVCMGQHQSEKAMEATNQRDQNQPLFQLCKATDASNPG
ncbi:hypothetical protein NW759_000835 [Fusarium solani]|nr:hypothetical protein NW759_000835 [Fusarium solani]